MKSSHKHITNLHTKPKLDEIADVQLSIDQRRLCAQDIPLALTQKKHKYQLIIAKHL